MSIGTTLEEFPQVQTVAERFANVWCSVGIHPHEAQKELLADATPLLERAKHPKVVAIGETGLDYYYEHSPRDEQKQNFRAHISAARETGLPLIVHTRDAEEDTIAILREEMGKGAFSGLIHCFTGTKTLADAALELGFCISVSGIATFKKSDELRDVLKDVPLDRLLVETDAPYLAPMPHRGKRNEPAFVAHTAASLAALKGVSVEEISRRDNGQFLSAVHKGRSRRNDAWKLPFWAAALPAACRASADRTGRAYWGACDPANPKNRRAPLFAARAAESRRTAPRRFWSTPRPICANNSSMRVCPRLDGVFITHDHADQTAWHRRSANDRDEYAQPRRRLCGRRSLSAHHSAFRLLLHTARRQRLSADPQCA